MQLSLIRRIPATGREKKIPQLALRTASKRGKRRRASPHLCHGTTWSSLHNRNQTALRRPGTPACRVLLSVPALPTAHHSLRPGAQRRGREGLLPAARHARPEARRYHRVRFAQGAGGEGAALAVWRTGVPCCRARFLQSRPRLAAGRPGARLSFGRERLLPSTEIQGVKAGCCSDLPHCCVLCPSTSKANTSFFFWLMIYHRTKLFH